MKRLVFLFLLALPFISIGQTVSKKGTWTYLLYADLYASTNFLNHETSLPVVYYNHKQLNNLHSNIWTTGISYKSPRFKTKLIGMVGDYSRFNLAHEKPWARYIHEATVSFKIHPKKELWLQAGIMPSHIGNESVMNWANWSLTRNLSSENSPYYQIGLSLTQYSRNKNWTFSGLLLTGWQTVLPTKKSKLPSFGTQVSYTSTDEHFTISWNQFLGQGQSTYFDSWRYYNNLYTQYTLTNNLHFMLAFDVGVDKKDDVKYGIWAVGTMKMRYEINKHHRLNFRYELMNDHHQIILPRMDATATIPSKIWTIGIGYDYQLSSQVLLRSEVKYLTDVNQAYIAQGSALYGSLSLVFNFSKPLLVKAKK